MADGEVAAFLKAMVRRLPPADAPVVAGSTPVVSFGDPHQAGIATLGINPSAVEFIEDGQFLSGSRRRLATLDSLGAERCDLLTDAQVHQVIGDCATYFTRRPYLRWFNPLDRLLASSLHVTYFDGSACHLDLVQWATDPVWRDIQDHAIRADLIDDGLPYLRAQLEHENVRLLLLNGRTVLNHVQRAGLAQMTPSGELVLGQTRCSLYTGVARGIQFLGWSANLQSSHGVSNAFTAQLAEWIAAHGNAESP